MTATAVIEEIKRLPSAEQSQVIRFVHELECQHQLTGRELRVLLERMVDSRDAVERERLREAIHRGFYGE